MGGSQSKAPTYTCESVISSSRYNLRRRTFTSSRDHTGSYVIEPSAATSNKELYEEAIKMIERDFDIEEKENSIYLHPKFEFIKNENI